MSDTETWSYRPLHLGEIGESGVRCVGGGGRWWEIVGGGDVVVAAVAPATVARGPASPRIVIFEAVELVQQDTGLGEVV